MSLPAPELTVSTTRFFLYPGVATDVSIELTNPSKIFAVAYKCKTTTPTRYVVRNRQGVIAANCTTRVFIQLQPGGVADADAEDQFLVEFRYITDDEASRTSSNKVDIGTLLGEGKKGKQRLVCVLAPPPRSNHPTKEDPAPAPAVATATATAAVTPVDPATFPAPIAAETATLNRPPPRNPQYQAASARAAYSAPGGAGRAAAAALPPPEATATFSASRLPILASLLVLVAGVGYLLNSRTLEKARVDDSSFEPTD
jgi:hypothetical protein